MKPSKEKIKGVANDVAGKLKSVSGTVSDNPGMKLKGEVQQLKGKFQIASATVKDAIKKKLK